MKIILVNNYDLLHIAELWKQEQCNAPAQHLWGYTTLDKYGIQVDVLPFKRYGFLKQISQKLKIFGDLDQQVRVLFKSHQYDAVYSAHHFTTLLLSCLRLLGLFNLPIVAIAYQAPKNNSFVARLFTRLFVGGNDKILCLSNSLLEDLKDLGVPANKLELIQWGVDLKFYQPLSDAEEVQAPQAQKFILSAGKTYRDYPTLTQAFHHLDCRLVICGAGEVTVQDFADSLPANVDIVETQIRWQELIEMYRQAYAIAVPLEIDQIKYKNAIGLTAATEAIAMGKPLIMTRNDYLGIDLEAEGIGLWVDPQDTAGWQKAISYLTDHPEIAQEMGRKARRLAEKRFNLEHFSKELAGQLQQACSPHPQAAFVTEHHS